ncbi:hypothetical protein ART_1979 [Arthrobacter sp. PAMC 25486]|uniref:VOC family protein n=1 Tax=Arthrobacter sp. PAMC 25486 TaxID=1494608 RepID=UPI000535D518|nr:VOC family protein [Arthrobacter sp. PAMC 25486]AIY01578.1 hypothetical protein ART_1979 [Arthrobacter sp. PAMC 25486]
MAVSGPDFISLQVRDLELSASFYETELGLVRAKGAPPHAVVFDTGTIPFAVREPLPGVDLATMKQPGAGMSVWLRASDVQTIHDNLAVAGTRIVSAPTDGPFGRTFTFADPDGYLITVHDKA